MILKISIEKKVEKIGMGSEESTNLFDTRKRIGYLTIYETIFFFTNLSITFWNYYYANKCF